MCRGALGSDGRPRDRPPPLPYATQSAFPKPTPREPRRWFIRTELGRHPPRPRRLPHANEQPQFDLAPTTDRAFRRQRCSSFVSHLCAYILYRRADAANAAARSARATRASAWSRSCSKAIRPTKSCWRPSATFKRYLLGTASIGLRSAPERTGSPPSGADTAPLLRALRASRAKAKAAVPIARQASAPAWHISMPSGGGHPPHQILPLAAICIAT